MGRIVLLVAIAVAFASTHVAAQVPDSERQVLLALYDAANGDGWFANGGWGGASGSECSWQGVTCSEGDASVTRVELSNNNLSGSIPPIGDLSHLVALNLAVNQLMGPIPTLKGLTELVVIDVSFNQLTGAIPPFAGCDALSYVQLSSNQLTGSIPDWSSARSLTAMDFSHNLLSGSIPSLAPLTALG